MADQIAYQKKLIELQKYVPFLENTINKLQREPGKPREPQISKLQTLLEILTNTSRKIKLDALERCEEVILRLKYQIEKKTNPEKLATNMHKYMCKDPPDKLADARNKLKQIETVTPSSPSPPIMDHQQTVPKPVVIPTEKVIPVVETRRINTKNFRVANKSFMMDTWDANMSDNMPAINNIPVINQQPMIQMPAVEIPQWQQTMQWHDQPQPQPQPLYQRRIDVYPNNTQQINRSNTIWNRSAIDEMPYKQIAPRDVITYDDFTRAASPLPKSNPQRSLIEVKIIPQEKINTPEIKNKPDNKVSTSESKISGSISDGSKNVSSNTKVTSKPLLSESDLQSLLSPVDSSSSNDSPNYDENDLDKLEQMRENIKKELKKEKSKGKETHKPKENPVICKTSTPIRCSAYAAKPKSPRVVEKSPKVAEKVIKEPDNIFGSLLSSIDDQIISQKKDTKKSDTKTQSNPKESPKVDGKKKELIKITFPPIKDDKTSKESEKPDQKLKKSNESKSQEKNSKLEKKEDSSKNDKSKDSDKSKRHSLDRLKDKDRRSSTHSSHSDKSDKDKKIDKPKDTSKKGNDDSKSKNEAVKDKGKDDSKSNSSDIKNKTDTSKTGNEHRKSIDKSSDKPKHTDKSKTELVRQKSIVKADGSSSKTVDVTSKSDEKTKDKSSENKAHKAKDKSKSEDKDKPKSEEKPKIDKTKTDDKKVDKSKMDSKEPSKSKIDDKKIEKPKLGDVKTEKPKSGEVKIEKSKTDDKLKIEKDKSKKDKSKLDSSKAKHEDKTKSQDKSISEEKSKQSSTNKSDVKAKPETSKPNLPSTKQQESNSSEKTTSDASKAKSNSKIKEIKFQIKPHDGKNTSDNLVKVTDAKVKDLFSTVSPTKKELPVNEKGSAVDNKSVTLTQKISVHSSIISSDNKIDDDISDKLNLNEDSCSALSVKSDSDMDDKMADKIVKFGHTGRLSDKYPHRRKPSTDSVKSGDTGFSESHAPVINIPLLGPQNQVPKDPRLKNQIPIPKLSPVDKFSFIQTYNQQSNNFSNTTQSNPFRLNDPRNHSDSFLKDSRTPSDPFLNDPRTPSDPFLNPPRTPSDPFFNLPRTSSDPFLNPPRTPSDPFLNAPRTPVDPFLNDPRTPSDPFLSPPQDSFRNDYNSQRHYQNTSYQQDGHFRSQTRFDPRTTPRHESDNSFWVQGYNQPPQRNQYDAPNRTPRSDFDSTSQAPSRTPRRDFEQNQTFNQYDLSQMGPIDYYDSINPDVNSHRSALLETSSIPNTEHPSYYNRRSDRDSHRDEGRWNRGISRGRGQYRGQSSYDRRSDYHHESRHSRDPRSSRNHDYQYPSDSRSYRPNIPPNFVTDYPVGTYGYYKALREFENKQRGIVDDRKKDSDSPGLDNKSKKEEKSIEPTSSDKKDIRSFKIPKIKKNDEDSAEQKELVEKVPEKENATEGNKEEETSLVKDEKMPLKEAEIKIKEEVLNTSSENIQDEPQTSKEPEVDNTSKPLEKTDLVNEFIQKILEQGDTSTFVQLIQKLGESIPQFTKHKRIRRVIESDSEDDSVNEEKTGTSKLDLPVTEKDVPDETPDPVVASGSEEPKQKTSNDVEPAVEESNVVVESVGERIKNRRRTTKPVLEEEPKKPAAKIRKKRSSLEMLQDDIREMFICEGVLTASERQRMCRIIREQEEALKKSQETQKSTECTPEKDKDNVTQDKKSKSKGKKKDDAKEDITRSSPRVLLEQTDISKYRKLDGSSDEESSDNDESESKSKTTVDKAKNTRNSADKSESLQENETPKPFRKKPGPKSKTMPKVDNPTDTDTQTIETKPIRKKPGPKRKVVKPDIKDDNENADNLETTVNELPKPKGKKPNLKKKTNQLEMKDEIESSKNDLDASIESPKPIRKKPGPKSKTLPPPEEKVEEDESDSETLDSFETASVASSTATEKSDSLHKVVRGKVAKKKRRGKRWATGLLNARKKRKSKMDIDPNEKEEETAEPNEPLLDSTLSESIDKQIEGPEEASVGEMEEKEITNSSIIEPDNEKPEEVKDVLNNNMEYYLQNKEFSKSCGYCSYKGRFMVNHYSSQHPTLENMLSRFPPDIAEEAIKESKQRNFDKVEAVQEEFKFKKDRPIFHCRFCNVILRNEQAKHFYDHVSTHTGEFRYHCTKCVFRSGQRQSLNSHFTSFHPGFQKPVFSPQSPAPPDFRIVFGYICDLCNYTQLERANVEKHLEMSHPNETGNIIKISMSKNAVPLPGEEIKTQEEIKMETPKTEITTEMDIDDVQIKKCSTPPPNKRRTRASEAESQKMPDLKVFLSPQIYEDEEKRLEQEKLQKMQEICDKIKNKRAELSFINKLKDKLSSVSAESESQEETQSHLETETETSLGPLNLFQSEPPAEHLLQIETIESKSGQIQPLNETSPEIVQPVSIENIINQKTPINSPGTNPQKEFKTSPIFQTEEETGQSESMIEVSSSLADDIIQNNLQKTPATPAPVLRKTKPFSSIIERLQANIQNAPDVPIIPEIPESPPSPVEDEEKIPLVVDIGLIKATIYSKTTKHYQCLVASCQQPNWTSEHEFRKHCLAAHTSYASCKICGGLPMDLIGNFFHLNQVHCSESLMKQFIEQRKKILENRNKGKMYDAAGEGTSKDNVPVEPSKPLLKIRKLPGDMLSTSNVGDVPETTDLNKPSTGISTLNIIDDANKVASSTIETESNDFDFGFQISNVKTLTREEELAIETDSAVTNLLISQDNTKTKPSDSSGQLLQPTLSSSPLNTNLPDLVPIAKTIEDKNMNFHWIKSLYKCHKKCGYATNTKPTFSEHLKKYHDDDDYKAIKCYYCHHLVGINMYISHVEMQHGHCRFICPYCEYRACSLHYIELHQKKKHFKNEIRIVQLSHVRTKHNLDKPIPKSKAISPYICRQGTCIRNFILEDDFRKHMAAHPIVACHVCHPLQKFVSIDALINHYLIHNIGKYQCNFCLKATAFPEQMFSHYSIYHPNQVPKATSRSEYRLPTIDRQVKPEDLEVIDLSYLYSDSIHKPVVIEKYMRENEISKIQEDDGNSGEDEFADVETLVKQFEEPKEIETINLVDDDLTPEDNVENPLNNAIDPLSIETETYESNQKDEENKVVTTDIKTFDLFRCGAKNCTFFTDNATKFKEHLFYCVEDGGYRCVHCDKQFNYASVFFEHIQTHGALRYICSICDEKAPFEHIIIKHMKVKHKVHTCKLVPNEDLFIALPNNKGVIQTVRNDPVEEKFSFEPEEFNKLPRMAIYSLQRNCAKCGYSSKVRTNLYRHLQAHLNDAPVPETAPVNPVPCLEKNEKMFDKMLNLANSSFSSRMGGKGDKNQQPTEANDLPAFVPAPKRYVCGAEGCNYLTHDDSMLKCHFNALHSHERSYKCPHCKVELANEFGEVSVEKIGFHLRMHDLYLYKCSLCDFIHYQRHKIDKHLGDKHPNKVPYIHVIRELDNSANLEGHEHYRAMDLVSESQTAQKEPTNRDDKIWKCTFCRHRSQNENDMKLHTKESHGIDSQYKCSLCSFKCDSSSNFTEHATSHGNSEPLLLASYYRLDVAQEKSSINTSDSDSFDTTPLWRRDTSRVKNIRGILIEDMKSPKKANKTTSKVETVTKDLFNGNEKIEKVDQSDYEIINDNELPEIVKKLDGLGTPFENLYSCPFCKKYTAVYKGKFYGHLCKELHYARHQCGLCPYKSHDYGSVILHNHKNHPLKDNTPKVKPTVNDLPPIPILEEWIEKVLNYQTEEISKWKLKLISDTTQNLIPKTTAVIEDENPKPQQENVEVIPHEDLLVASSSTTLKSPNKTYKCPKCDFEAKALKTLKKHKLIHSKPVYCKLCKYFGPHVRSIKLHFTLKHPKEKVSFTYGKEENNTKIAKRKIIEVDKVPSEETVKSVEKIEVKAPEILKENLRYLCMHCMSYFNELSVLKLHCIHETWTQKYNMFCKYQITDVTVAKDTSNYLYKCKNCDQTGTSAQILAHHEEKHPDARYAPEHLCRYKCQCGFNSKSAAYIRTHIKSHSLPEASYDIYHQLINQTEVKDKVILISDESLICDAIPTLYKCRYCEKHFNSLEQMTEHHQTFHSNLNFDKMLSTLFKFKCPTDFCEVSTNVISNLKNHIREHTILYKCTYCPAEFQNLSLLSDHHGKTHKGKAFSFSQEENPFKISNDYKDNLLVLGTDGTYSKIKERLTCLKRRATEPLELHEHKIQILENTSTLIDTSLPGTSFQSVSPSKKINFAKKSTAKPPIKKLTARKSTTPIRKRPSSTIEGFSYYGTKPRDFSEYANLTTEANIQGNMIKVSVIGLQYILKLFPKVVVKDIFQNP